MPYPALTADEEKAGREALIKLGGLPTHCRPALTHERVLALRVHFLHRARRTDDKHQAARLEQAAALCRELVTAMR